MTYSNFGENNRIYNSILGFGFKNWIGWFGL